MSGSCYEISDLADVCGECKVDADCAGGGCTIPNPIPGHETGAFCNAGQPGGGCETTAVCQTGLSCALVQGWSGLGLVIRTCSECSSDGDCGAGQVCGVDVNILEFTGQRVCQPVQSVPTDGFCTNDGTVGNDGCASGFCGIVEASGLVSLEVCGECLKDVDCPAGQVCNEGFLDLGTLIPTGRTCDVP